MAGMNPNSTSGPRVSSKPARTNVIRAVTSKRSKRADSIPQAVTSAATIARSEALIVSLAGGTWARPGRPRRNGLQTGAAALSWAGGPGTQRSACRYLRRRETRRAVRRPVRRATLRPPNISGLLFWSGFGSWCVCCGRGLQLVQLPRLLGRDQPEPHQVQRADEAVADAETSGAGYRIPKRHRPVVLQQDQCRR
jgi:hypothetical protein